jgi:hypothetical protein
MNTPGFLIVLVCALLSSACGEQDLKRNQIESISVVGSLASHTELGLTIDELQAPFERLLKKRGLTLEKEIKGNYLTVTAYIDRAQVAGEQLYVVNFWAAYHEQCTTVRTKQEALCTLWEFYEPTETFTSPSAAREHVLRVIDTAAKEFLAEFDHNVK